MAKPQANVDLLTDVKQSLAAMDKYQRKMGMMLDDMDHRLRKFDKQGDKAAKTFKKLGKDILNAGMGIVGMNSAAQGLRTMAQLIRKEFEFIANLDLKAKDTYIETAKARENFRWSGLAKGSDMTMGQIDEMINNSPYPDKAMAWRVLTGVASSKMSNKMSEIAPMVLETMAIRPELAWDEGAGQKMGEAIGMWQDAYGGTTKQQMAMFFSGLQASRTTSVEAFGKYIAPAVQQAASLGWDQQSAMSMISAIGTQIQDPDGAITMTTAINFMQDLEALRRENQISETGADFINILRQNNPKSNQMRDQLLGVFQNTQAKAEAQGVDAYSAYMAAMEHGRGDLHGRARGKMGPITLVDPGYDDNKFSGWNLFQSGMEMIPKLAESESFLDQKLRERDADIGYMPLELKAGYENLKNQRFNDPRMAARSIAVQAMSEMAELYGGTSFEDTLQTTWAKFNQPFYTTKEAIEALKESNKAWRERAASKAVPQVDLFGRELYPGDNTPRDAMGRPVIDPAVQQYSLNFEALLEKMIVHLERIDNAANAPKLNDPAPPNIPVDTQ